MGCLENISYDRFPQQKEDLGTTVNLGLNGERVVPAVVVRSDAEFPNRQVFRTSDGLYIQSSELDNFRLPEQGNYKDKKVRVCFHYNTDNTLEGRIVRYDMEEPRLRFIELDDGRVVETSECQYQPIHDKPISRKKVETVATEDINQIKKHLKRRNSSERIKLLQGVYKQLIPSRKGKIANGTYNDRYSSYQKKHQHFVQVDWTEESAEQLATQIVKHTASMEFVGFLVDEMRKYDQLQNHANRLEKAYLGPLQVDMLNGTSRAIQIKHRG